MCKSCQTRPSLPGTADIYPGVPGTPVQQRVGKCPPFVFRRVG